MPDTETNQQEAVDHGATLYAWDIPEYERHHRTRTWFFVAGAIAIVTIVYSVVTQNYLFIIIIALAAFIFYRQTVALPGTVRFAITEDGIELGADFYAFRALRNFWIHYEPTVSKMLFLTFKSTVQPGLHVPLQDQNPVEIRQALIRYIPEDMERENEPLTHAIGRNLKI